MPEPGSGATQTPNAAELPGRPARSDPGDRAQLSSQTCLVSSDPPPSPPAPTAAALGFLICFEINTTTKSQDTGERERQMERHH